ncbi:MAG TPA: helix-turn-helix domain-containing protein [Acidimicrobiales bacterium]|jgi:excisionase family DNA binding protein
MANTAASGKDRQPPVLHLEDVPTVAGRLSVTPKEVRRLIARGDLFSVKLGRRRLVPSYEVDRYITSLVAAAEEGRSA